VKDLEKAGKFAEGSGEEALGSISQYWRYPEGSYAREMDQGTFE
jgi:hypothetical protein